jgi:hypothetical protein
VSRAGCEFCCTPPSVAPLPASFEFQAGGLPRARVPRLSNSTSVHRESDLRSQDWLRRAVPTVVHNRRRGFGSDQVDIAQKRGIVRCIPIVPIVIVIPYRKTKRIVSDTQVPEQLRGAVKDSFQP